MQNLQTPLMSLVNLGVCNRGSLQPWKSVPSKVFGLGGASPVIPNGCNITQVHLVHRHGARYPTGPTSGPAQFAQKVHEKAKSGFQVIADDLQFLESWTYKLGDQSLTPFGEEELCVFYISKCIESLKSDNHVN